MQKRSQESVAANGTEQSATQDVTSLSTQQHSARRKRIVREEAEPVSDAARSEKVQGQEVVQHPMLPMTTEALYAAKDMGMPFIPETLRHRYREALASNTPDVIITVSEYFQVVELNPAAVNVLHGSRSSLLGRSCTEVLHCRNLNNMQLCGTSSCPIKRVQEQHQPLPNEELLIGTLTEQPCEVSTSVTPIDAGFGQCIVFMARDVSALKLVNRVRSNFVSMVSHELRTPLNSIHGFIDLLLQGHMGPLNEEQHLYLGYTQEGVQQLISIVEDILFMTRSDLGQFEIKPQEVSLRSLVRQILNNLQPQAHKAEIVLIQDIPSPSPILYIDPKRIQQVLNNLLANALKFTPPAGSITVQVRPYNEQFVMVSVIDTGYGIPVEDRPHIFERFYQSNHSQQSRMGGYGLGLSIAQLIVEQHGGTIGFDSVIDKGTTFYFTLPLHKKQ